MEPRIKSFSVILSISLNLLLVQAAFSAVSGSGSASPYSEKLDATSGSQLKLLELKYFEHNFNGDLPEERVSRVEKLIYGEPLSGSPSDRVKQMVSTLLAEGETLDPIGSEKSDEPQDQNPSRQSGKKKQSRTQTDSNESSAASGNNFADPGNYPHISNLEKEILGKTYEGQTLPSRLGRLEEKAFGSASDSSNFSARTDRLEDYAVKVLHDKPFAVNPDIDKTYVIPVRRSYPLASAGYPQQAMHHFFSPTRMSPDFAAMENAQAMQAAPAAAAVDDDPLVRQKDPPPQGTRMATEVAWCEMQLYGHTCPNMHLTERLRQLNDTTRAVSGKQSDMQLMDDMSPIIKAVLARRGTNNSISSTNNPAR